jgi:integrase
VGHVARLLGRTLVVAVTDATVKLYQDARLKEKASAKSINEETGFLLRMLDEQGDILRAKLRREHALKLQVDEPVAKAFGSEEKARLLAAAKARRSPHIYPALMLNLHAGLRDGEIRGLQWGRIDLVKAVLVVGKAKTLAGQGRAVPLNSDVLRALTEHAQWYLKKFGETKPEWYVFPAGQPQPTDPTRPVSSFKTAWAEVKMAAEITGRWHDGRHSYITALAESGEASDETIRQLAGHVSKQMLARYSHIGMEAKRRAVAALEVKPARSETEQNAVGVVKVSTKVELVN